MKNIIILLSLFSMFYPSLSQEMIWEVYDSSDGINGDIINDIHIDNKGILWFTYKDKLVNSWDPVRTGIDRINNGIVEPMYLTYYSNMVEQSFSDICHDSKGNIYCSCFILDTLDIDYVSCTVREGHFTKYDGNEWTIEFSKTYKCIPISIPYSIAGFDVDGNDDLVIAMNWDYLIGEDWSKIKYYQIYKITNGKKIILGTGYSNSSINKIKFDSDNNLVFTFNKYNEEWVSRQYVRLIFSDFVNHRTIELDFGKRFSCFIIDKKGIIWIGTSKGLMSWDPNTDDKEYYVYPPLGDSIKSIAEDKLDNLWIGTNSGLVKIDRFGNQTLFNEENTGQSLDNITDIAIGPDNKKWFVVEENKILSLEYEIISSAPENSEISIGLTTHPNPFSQSTTINYELIEAGHISLELFDMLGNKIAVLVDDWQEAGKHQAVFNVGNTHAVFNVVGNTHACSLPAGMYMMKMTTSDGVVTEKVVYVE